MVFSLEQDGNNNRGYQISSEYRFTWTRFLRYRPDCRCKIKFSMIFDKIGEPFLQIFKYFRILLFFLLS